MLLYRRQVFIYKSKTKSKQNFCFYKCQLEKKFSKNALKISKNLLCSNVLLYHHDSGTVSSQANIQVRRENNKTIVFMKFKLTIHG